MIANGGSASSSEVVVGVLKESGRARFVGETTYGKGTVHETAFIAEGVKLRLTEFVYRFKDGSSLEGGLTPTTKLNNNSLLRVLRDELQTLLDN